MLGVVKLLLLVFAVGCAPRPPASTDRGQSSAGGVELPGTSWRLEDLGGMDVLERVEATLEFPEAGKAAGRASCNRFFGTVEISAESIKVGPLAATKMSCGDATDAQEKKYLEALQAAERFAFDDRALLIYSRGMEKPLRFARN
jgi:heat shock protein HslJ